MSKKIKFIAANDYGWNVADRPYPAKHTMPKWWKEMPPYIISPDNPDGKKPIIKDVRTNGSPKKCTPMMDAMGAGYIVPLWADIQVKSSSDSEYLPEIRWKTTREVFESHIDGSADVQVPHGYHHVVFKFINLWCMKTPPGYSVMITEPAGHNDLPLKALPAIVDTDKYDAALPTPMFLQEGFEGIIERGTPMFQVIPFKRDNWEAEFDYYKEEDYYFLQEKYLRINAFGNYLKTQWTKKTYK